MPLTIHPDLQFLMPALLPEAYAQLEANLLHDGCLNPLIIWREEQVLLDGHHRLRICEQHGIEYPIQELSLPDLDAAQLWILEHQDGRRNLTPEPVEL